MSWKKTTYLAAGLMIVLMALVGFYLTEADLSVSAEHLVKAGHGHGMGFALATLLYLFLLDKLSLSQKTKNLLSGWNILTFLGPLGLVLAGLTGEKSFLPYTSILGEGSFLLLWVLLVFFFLKKYQN